MRGGRGTATVPVRSHRALRSRHERDAGSSKTAVHVRGVDGARDDGLARRGLRSRERVRILGTVETDVDRDGARDLGRLEDQAHARRESFGLHLGRHVDGVPVGSEIREVGSQRQATLRRKGRDPEPGRLRRVGRHDRWSARDREDRDGRVPRRPGRMGFQRDDRVEQLLGLVDGHDTGRRESGLIRLPGPGQ
jgi:hypothetical protein